MNPRTADIEVRYVADNLPDDASPIEVIASAARASYGRALERRSPEENLRLVRRLARDRHTSPFEMVNFTFFIRAPLVVAVHFLRHRTARVSMKSYRYKTADTFYLPESFRRQAEANKQASAGPLEEADDMAARVVAAAAMESAFEAYQRLLELGVAREQARIVLPQSVMQEWLWNIDFRNLAHFLDLRLAQDAQAETRFVATRIRDLLSERHPELVKIYLETSGLW